MKIVIAPNGDAARSDQIAYIHAYHADPHPPYRNDAVDFVVVGIVGQPTEKKAPTLIVPAVDADDANEIRDNLVRQWRTAEESTP